MKGKFDAYVLWPLAKKLQNWIVDQSTAHDFTVDAFSYLPNNIFDKKVYFFKIEIVFMENELEG